MDALPGLPVKINESGALARVVSADPCASRSGLLTLEEACRIAASYAQRLAGVETVRLDNAVGRVLADDVVATLALPPFDQSAMDGYAVRARDLPAGGPTHLKVGGRLAAGQSLSSLVGPALRIFTGAPVPPGFDSVIMQENVRREGDTIVAEGPIRPGSNVRRAGEDCTVGQPLVRAGRSVDPRALALIAAQGMRDVCVRRKVRICVISTGNELCQPGALRESASIYDSNRPMLIAMCRLAGADVLDGGQIPDDPERIAAALEDRAADVDLVVTTGGVSVGEEDHSLSALERAKAEFTVLRTAIKPGKPGLVGRIGHCAYLGLPGNPNAAIVGWLMLGRSMLATMQGQSIDLRPAFSLPMAHPYERAKGRREFVPGRLVRGDQGSHLEFVAKAGSARLQPLAAADGLAEIPPDVVSLAPGDLIGFHSFNSL